MSDSQRFSFINAEGKFGAASLMPLLPVTLTFRGQSRSAIGLLVQINFFAAFNVCFFHSESVFELTLK